MRGLALFHSSGLGRIVSMSNGLSPRLRRPVAGIDFPSPVGVAAGLDKQGIAAGGLVDLGFGFVEVGTVTALPQPGNSQPRLFRLLADHAILNRMGFNNPGVKAVTRRVAKLRRRSPELVIGINIGKSKATPLEHAADDYAHSARIAAQHADYLVINVSSPNTPGLRTLQALEPLREIVEAVTANAGATPVFVKLAPDMHDDDILAVAGLVREQQLAGIVATNTTVSREGLATPNVDALGDGGVSGPPLRARSLAVLDLLRPQLPAPFAIISVGGIASAADVQERLQHGADLVQIYTSFIYAGPALPRTLNRELRRATQQ